MTSHALTPSVVLIAALAVLGPLLGGCAGAGEEDLDRDPAYPQAIGYTVPPSQPPSASQPVAAVDPSTEPGPEDAPPAPPPPPPGDDEVANGPEPMAPAAGEDYADTDPAALTDFRSALDPYGSWVDDPTYGTVWVPSESVVGSDFEPYETAGHWDYDNEDYTWVSDYDWGWAPFHYGRWAYAAPYGWEWVPGREYAGAWVSWRYGYGDWAYVGWAPLAPTWGWYGGAAVGLGFVPAVNYRYCPSGQLFAPRLNSVMVNGGQAGVIGAHTRPWVAASPSVTGRVAATPHVNGPSPAILRIPQNSVMRGAGSNRGVIQARAFSHAGTAEALGAREPAAYASRGYVAARPSANPSASAASHFGGKLGYGFRGDAAAVRPYSAGAYGGSAPRFYGSQYGSPYRGYSSGYAARPSVGSGWNYGGRSAVPSFYRGSPGYHGAPAGVAHPTVGHSGGNGYSDGGYSGNAHAVRASPGVSRGGGGFSNAFHGGGFSGGGGGRGGGGRR